MIPKLATWAIRRYVGGPGRSWVWTSLALIGIRMVRSVTGRREVIDVNEIERGDQIVIEHRSISHGKQIKQFKAEKKAAKRAVRAEKRAARAERRASGSERPRFRIRSGRGAGTLEA